ncbi:MAG: hypothetical protein HY720_07985 [Planctomycetes bacterium]|nr:hypothetical protein [Planctomycetota bacterium]
MPRHALVLVSLLALATPALADEENTIWDRLDSKVVSLEFKDAPIGEVLVFLSETIEATIMTDPELTKNRTEEELRITVRLKDVTARTALDVVLATTRLGAQVEHGVMVVKDRQEITAGSTLEEYDLAGLVYDSADRDEGEWDDSYFVEFGPPPSIFEEVIAPGSWDPPNSLVVRNGKLIVRHTREVHAQIRELIAGLRAVAARQVEIETSVYRLSPESLAELRSEGPTPATDLPEQLDARIARGERAGDELMCRFACVTASGVRRTVVGGAAHPFVENHEPWGLEGSAASVPSVGWKDEELRATFVPFVRDADGAILIGADFDWTRDVEPGRSSETDAGEIDLPRTRRLVLALRETVPAGRCLVAEAGDSTVVIVRPVAREVPGLVPPPPAEPAGEREKREILDRLDRTDMAPSFDDRPFEEIVSEIADRAGVNVVIDRSVTDQLGEDGLKVSFHARSISARRLLELLCDLHGLAASFLSNVLIVATRDSCGWGEAPVLVLHDIRDLALDIQREPIKLILGHDPSRLAPARTAPMGVIFREEIPYSRHSSRVEYFQELIRALVDPESWDTEGNAIRLVPGQLLTVNRPGTQEKVAAQLEIWRKTRGRPQRARMIRFVAGAGFLAGLQAGVLSAEEVASLSKRIDSEEGTSDVERFTAAGVERQFFGAGRRDQVHYVSRFDPAAGGGTDVRAPVSAWYRTGLVVNLKVAALPEGRFRVEIEGEAARLLGTPSVTEVEGGDVECPRVAEATLVHSAILATGEGLLLATGGPADEAGGVEYLLVQIEPSGSE